MGVCFCLLPVYRGGGSLLRTVSPIVSVPWAQKWQSPDYKCSRVIPSVLWQGLMVVLSQDKLTYQGEQGWGKTAHWV